MNEREIFVACLEIDSPDERRAFLDKVCGANWKLRADIDLLLREQETLGSFLEAPARPARGGPEAPVSESVGSAIGPYKLLQLIGEGGMGTVYLAEQDQPVRRRVALKVIKPGMDSAQVIARFEAERQALALMEHQNIARVLDGGTTAMGRPYFVMELVNGLPITEYCDTNCLTPRARLELFVPVCHAIQHAHQKGIIHRDIKPSNVMVTLYDGKPVPKVIDFGVAKAIDQRLTARTMFTAFGQIVGTWEYMSPEQAALSGLDVDTRSDIYSLGVLAYELLTGSTPLEQKQLRAAAFDEILRLVREEEPPTPSARLSDSGERLPTISAQRQTEPARLRRLVRGELDWIVMRALEKDRRRRYETASDLARDVERHLHDEPVDACPPSARYRLYKFIRRHRASVASALLVFLALIGGVIATSWQMYRAERALHGEEEQRGIAESKAIEAERQEARAVLEAQQANLARYREAEQAKLAETRKEEAVASAQKAIASKQTAEALLAFFLNDLLRQSQPIEQADAIRAQGGGFQAKENPTIKDLLDRTSAQLTPEKMDSRFPGQKEVQGKILQAVGDCYLGIGIMPKALEFLTRARDFCQAEFGGDDLRTLNAQEHLAAGLRRAGKPTQAIAMLADVLKAARQKYGPEHEDTLIALDLLAQAHLDTGNVAEGIRLLEEIRDTRARINKPELGILNNLAAAYWQAQRLTQAVEMYEQLQVVAADQLGPEHPNTLTAQNNLGVSYQQVRRLPESIAVLEKVRESRIRVIGPDHPDTLATVNNLGVSYLELGKLAEAREMLKQAVDGRTRKLGAEHPATLNSVMNLGRTYQMDGKLEQALPLLLQAAQGMEKRNFQHQYAAAIVIRLLNCLDQLERYAESETWQRKLLAANRARSGVNTPVYATGQSALGQTLLQQQKWAEAESLLRESLERLQKLAAAAKPGTAGGVSPWSIGVNKSALGQALVKQQKFAEAEPLLLAGYQELAGLEGPRSPQDAKRLQEVLERIIQLYESWAKKEQAAEWRKKLPAAPKGKESSPKS